MNLINNKLHLTRFLSLLIIAAELWVIYAEHNVWVKCEYLETCFGPAPPDLVNYIPIFIIVFFVVIVQVGFLSRRPSARASGLMTLATFTCLIWHHWFTEAYSVSLVWGIALILLIIQYFVIRGIRESDYDSRSDESIIDEG